VEEAIVRRVGTASWGLWFNNHTRLEVDDDGVRVRVLNQHLQDWLKHKFGDAVRAAGEEVFGRPVMVRYVVDAGLNAAPEPSPPAPSPLRGEGGGEEAAPAKPITPTLPPQGGGSQAEAKAPRAGRRWHALKDFVVGPCNRVAYASAVAVVEEPGQGANPLVLHGPVGTGKTHLLEGIYAGLRKAWPDLRVQFVTAEEFMNRFVQALRFGKQAGFRKQFRECGALLLDDLNFLASKKSKRATQEEFLHTFDALLADGRQLVLTTDCHPRLSDDLLPELTDRLLGGAVWGLLPPDPETRLAILRAKAARGLPIVPDDVLVSLAKQMRGNVRELEGALNGVRHFAKVTGRKVDLALVREALADLLRHAVRVVGVADVDEAVCGVLRLPHGTLQSPQRSWAVSHPRMVAIYLCRKHTAATYGEISRHFGAKTHSTAVAAEKRVRQWLEADGLLTLGDRRWRVQELVERAERRMQN
jgi:chromosomal replication initiator protein